MAQKTKYIVVPSHGCYGSSSCVKPVRRFSDKTRAIKYAEKATAEYRREMARYGGSSGGYRVIESSDNLFFGNELDAIPTVQ